MPPLRILALLASALSAAPPCRAGIPMSNPVVPGVSWANIAWGHHDGGRDDITHAKVVLLDLENLSERAVANIKAQDKFVICYMSAGTVEEFRGHYKRNRLAWDVLTLGPMDDWYGERWLDIRRVDRLLALFGPVLDEMAAAGCDGVETDNIDCYGSPDCAGHLGGLTYNEIIQYNVEFILQLTDAAHARGLLVFAKNALELHPDIMPYTDGLIVENCGRFKECARLSMWTAFEKPVFAVEYMRPHLDADRDACANLPASVMLKHCVSDSRRSLCVEDWVNCVEEVSVGDPIKEEEKERTDM